MKTTLKRAGAVGLAAATIVTGLSFGTEAAMAAPAAPDGPAATAVTDETSSTTAAPAELRGPFITYHPGDAKRYAVSTGVPARNLLWTDAAKTPDPAIWTFPRVGSSGPVRGTGAASNVCLQIGADPSETPIQPQTCSGGANQTFSWWRANGGLTIAPLVTPRTWMLESPNGTYVTWRNSSQATLIDTTLLKAIFTGGVDSVDVSARTAQISGNAAPGAYVVINGREQVQASSTGAWSYTLTGLALGSNTVTLEQYENSVKTGTTTVQVNLPVATLTATASFPADRAQNAVLSGAAQPGATVVVTDAAGTELARTTALTGSGAWSTSIPAPKAGGDYPVRVRQEVGGDVAGQVSATVPYGAAVTITTPVEGLAHDGGRLPMDGRGESGAAITVREQGTQNVIGTATVIANGTWHLTTTTQLDNKRHVLEVTQAGKGANTTVATVTINPDGTGVTQPFAFTSPSNGETVIAPKYEVTFTGRGTTGAVVEIMNAFNSRVIGTATIGEDGTWSTTGSVGSGNQKIRAKVDLNGTIENNYIDIVVRKNAGVEQPFALVSPTNGQTIIAPTNKVTFTGRGTTGDTVQIVNTYNARVIDTATVGDTGTWSASGSVGFGTQNLNAVVTHQGAVTDNPFTVIVKKTAGVEKPFAITAPANGATVVAPDGQVTFTGTGTTGARVVLTAGSGRRVVDTLVGADGTWSGTSYLTAQRYDLATSYTVPGGTPVTGTTTVVVQNSAGVEKPFAITTPADGSTVTAPDYRVTFSGTGTTGATVEMKAGNGRQVIKTTVRDDGTWTATGDLNHQRYTLDVTYTPKDGDPVTTTHTVTVAPGA
ncbi:Ig-like domain-containing protein [Frigoribacterium faeni]|uniref:Ig-like domain-containing protein n=1 Tax=Frigoribacterium faeni TaxID=145483 RepID=UPI00141B85A7|nr:Ig-like domain-containing protein [Frigoribacterium faeni]NIJ05827.1 hypothetical protein [Frigoribacterium faeni]